MTNIDIISAVISSSVLSSLLTAYANSRIQSKNYKHEYYKKILEKRMATQEDVIHIADQLKIQVKLNNGTLCHRLCANGEAHFTNFSILVAATVSGSFWLSTKQSEILQEFNVFLLNEFTHELNKLPAEEKDEALITLGLTHREEIRNFRTRIEKQLLNEFASLANIEEFLKSSTHAKDRLYELKT